MPLKFFPFSLAAPARADLASRDISSRSKAPAVAASGCFPRSERPINLPNSCSFSSTLTDFFTLSHAQVRSTASSIAFIAPQSHSWSLSVKGSISHNPSGISCKRCPRSGRSTPIDPASKFPIANKTALRTWSSVF